jgi:hypothetical protein
MTIAGGREEVPLPTLKSSSGNGNEVVAACIEEAEAASARGRPTSGDTTIKATTWAEDVVRPATSCLSLNEGQQRHPLRRGSKAQRPQFLRTATRLSIHRGRSNSRAFIGGHKYSLAVEPEIQAVNSPISVCDGNIEDIGELQDAVGDLEQVTQRGQDKTESFFTRHKLERGSLTAFKREARNIIERDIPLILHRDNIIKVWTDKVSY